MLVCLLVYLSQKTNQYKTFLEHLMSNFFSSWQHKSIKSYIVWQCDIQCSRISFLKCKVIHVLFAFLSGSCNYFVKSSVGQATRQTHCTKPLVPLHQNRAALP